MSICCLYVVIYWFGLLFAVWFALICCLRLVLVVGWLCCLIWLFGFGCAGRFALWFAALGFIRVCCLVCVSAGCFSVFVVVVWLLLVCLFGVFVYLHSWCVRCWVLGL